MMDQKRGTGKIISENEAATANALADQLGQQVAPGAYLSGKRLVATESYRDVASGMDILNLVFEGNWDLRIASTTGFNVQIVEHPVLFPEENTPAQQEGQEGEVIEDADWSEAAVDEGKRLMSGESA